MSGLDIKFAFTDQQFKELRDDPRFIECLAVSIAEKITSSYYGKGNWDSLVSQIKKPLIEQLVGSGIVKIKKEVQPVINAKLDKVIEEMISKRTAKLLFENIGKNRKVFVVSDNQGIKRLFNSKEHAQQYINDNHIFNYILEEYFVKD